jgi:ferrous iron transport protein B
MFLVFDISQSTVGPYIADTLVGWIEAFQEMAAGWVESASPFVQALLIDGIIGGVGAVVGFLPLVMVMYFLIALLEDCGYMARVAFLMDKLFKSIGLSGKAFIPLLSCFGCAVPGILATKTLKSDKERRIAIMISPFFSCGAKLPIWSAFAALLFFGAYRELIVLGVYFFGIIVSIIAAMILNKLVKGESEPFIMEMPDYHRPQARTVGMLLWEKCKHYVIKAGTLIAASTVVLWFLTSFGWNFKMVEDMNLSILGSISSVIAPIFVPLGFGSSEYASVFVIASFAGLIAKEEVPAVLESLGVLEAAVASVAPAAIFAFMAFNLLVVPCMAAVSAAKGELNNKKHFALTIVFWIVIAYVFGMIVYGVASLIAIAWWVSLILLALLIGAIIAFIVISYKREKVCNQ